MSMEVDTIDRARKAGIPSKLIYRKLIRVSMEGGDTIDRARKGDVEYFRGAPLRDIQTAVDKENGISCFSIAVIRNQLECCKMIYSRCPSLLYQCSRNSSSTAMHHAVNNGLTQIVEFLIWANDKKDYVGEETDVESGLRREQIKNFNLLTMPNEWGCVPLHYAVQFGASVEIVKMLIEADHGRDSLTMQNSWERVPLHEAVGNATVEIVKMLIEADHGRDSLKMVNREKETPLHMAVKGGNIEMVKALVEANPDFEYGVDESGDTPLSSAFKAKSGSITSLLLKKQPDQIKLRDNKGWTPIHYVVNEGDLNLMNEIIEILPSSMEVGDNECQNCLHLAAKCENLQLVQRIIGTKFVSSIVLNGKDIHGHTPLHVAALTGNKAIILCLLNDPRVDMTTTNNQGQHVLDAIKNLNLLTMADECGWVPLHYAVFGASVETVKRLIEADHGRDSLKMVNREKETPLHMAVKGGNIEMVKALVEANPDFEYGVDESGDTPLSLAFKAKSGLITDLLLKKQLDKIKLQISDDGWTPIHQAVNQGDIRLVKDIIKICPSSMEVVDNEGQNCLHLAAKYQNLQLVQCIIRAKSVSSNVLNCQDIYGDTPLHVAALIGNEAIIKCLLYDRRVDKRIRNNEGHDVLDVITCDYDPAKAGLFGPTGRMTQNEWKNQSDFDLVVGALIAAVSFTAGITVPGGYISDGPNQGSAVLSKKIPFITFVVSNNFALMFSLYAVFSHFCTRRLQREEDISHQLKVAQYCTLGAIFAMMVAFIAGSYAVLANSKPLAVTGLVCCCCFFGFASRPLCRMGMQHSVQTRIQMCWTYVSRCWEKTGNNTRQPDSGGNNRGRKNTRTPEPDVLEVYVEMPQYMRRDA